MLAHSTLILLPKKNEDKHKINKHAGLSVIERWEIAKSMDDEMEDVAPYSATQIGYFRTALFKFFAWATDIAEYITKNPAPSTPPIHKRLPIPSERKTKRANFYDEDALKIINYCKDDLTHPYHWAILLMAYHGVRNSEAVNLNRADIITHRDTQIPYIYIRGGKTDAAERRIPIHRELISLGFLEFSEVNDKLFNFKTAKLSSYYFNTLRPKLRLPELSDEGLLLSLYSFRHSVTTKMGRMNIGEPQRKYLIGHRDVTSSYTHLLEPKDFIGFKGIINRVSYSHE